MFPTSLSQKIRWRMTETPAVNLWPPYMHACIGVNVHSHTHLDTQTCVYMCIHHTHTCTHTHVISVVLHYKNTKKWIFFQYLKIILCQCHTSCGQISKIPQLYYCLTNENNYQPAFTSTVHSSISAITGQTEEHGPEMMEAFYEVCKEHWRIVISKLWACLMLICKSAHVHELYVNIYFSRKGILKHTSVSHVRLSFVT